MEIEIDEHASIRGKDMETNVSGMRLTQRNGRFLSPKWHVVMLIDPFETFTLVRGNETRKKDGCHRLGYRS
ncbi:hypothetical protein [Anoxybacteroides rupiense]|uniref:hypothetical protein n=1 Tax=Anoxybacteroides rupiense TaxID=311460 RepID=UPI001F09DA4E|nr:hypothetical protein [Anoxybacillus rupiensis]